MKQTLDSLRKNIDDIDKELFVVLAKRFSLVREIGARKKEGECRIEDLEREGEVRVRFVRMAQEMGVDAKIAAAVCELLLRESKRIQQNLCD